MKTKPKKEKKKSKTQEKKISWAIKITLNQLQSRSFPKPPVPPSVCRRQPVWVTDRKQKSRTYWQSFTLGYCCLFYDRESLFVRNVSGLDIHETYFWGFCAFGIFMCYLHVNFSWLCFSSFFFFLRRDLERVWFMVLIEASCFRKLCLHSGAFTLWRRTSGLFQVLVWLGKVDLGCGNSW